MTPRRLVRESGPVEAEQLTRHNLAAIFRWLDGHGVQLEVHRGHGVLLHLPGGPVSVNYGDHITRSLATGRIEVWDDAELRAEHREEETA